MVAGSYLDHDVIRTEGKLPTCTEDGLTDGRKCNRCGEVLEEQIIISATGEHTYGEWQTVIEPEIGIWQSYASLSAEKSNKYGRQN